MINPNDNIPPDDANYTDNDDQQSQQDLHSNGFDDEDLPVDQDDTGRLQQAEEASAPSFTLDADQGIAPEQASGE